MVAFQQPANESGKRARAAAPLPAKAKENASKPSASRQDDSVIPLSLVLAWPEYTRADAKVLIDGVPMLLPTKGEVSYMLRPRYSPYQIKLVRPGYETIEFTRFSRAGENAERVENYVVEWTKSEFAVADQRPTAKGNVPGARAAPEPPPTAVPTEPAAGGTPADPDARDPFDTPPRGWPDFSVTLAGGLEVRIRNPNNFQVRVGLRSGRAGDDFLVSAFGVQSVYVASGRYDIYFQYSNEPNSLYQGDSFTLNNDGVEIRIVKVVNGNYGVRKIR